MRYFLFAIALLSISPARSQVNKEFEGIIKYQHTFRFNSPDVDSSEVFNALGTSSVFYYKKGNYKWVYNYEHNSNIEYFDSKTQTVYSKYGENDTLFMNKKNGYDDSLVLFTLSDTDDTVCGLHCKKAETFSITKDDTNLQAKRILYYSSAVSIRPDRFSGYRTYATNKVVKEIKCWPIKIEFGEAKYTPFIFIIEAIEIIPKQLTDAEVYLPPNKPIKPLPLF
jgi:hypothetical protein